MNVSERTIEALEKLLTGDCPRDRAEAVAPYLSGPRLVAFFNDFGFNDVYPRGGGFPSRWTFAQERLRALNGKGVLADVISAALAPGRFENSTFTQAVAAEFINAFLERDGFQAVDVGGSYRVVKRGAANVALPPPAGAATEVNRVFIGEQIAKCERKLAEPDLDGAITNARSLVRQVLSGLHSIVSGIAGMRNKMSDSHAPEYRPEERHARLAINAAKTLVDFLFGNFEAQVARGTVTPVR